MIIFTNLDKSTMTAKSPTWQEDVMQRVNDEYQELAIQTSDAIRDEFTAIQSKIQPGYYATAFEKILRTVPRYAYIKGVDDGFGTNYDVQIDLALHTVSFNENSD